LTEKQKYINIAIKGILCLITPTQLALKYVFFAAFLPSFSIVWACGGDQTERPALDILHPG
jgi:hypothetical protein